MFLPQVAAQQNKLVVKKAEGKQGLTGCIDIQPDHPFFHLQITVPPNKNSETKSCSVHIYKQITAGLLSLSDSGQCPQGEKHYRLLFPYPAYLPQALTFPRKDANCIYLPHVTSTPWLAGHQWYMSHHQESPFQTIFILVHYTAYVHHALLCCAFYHRSSTPLHLLVLLCLPDPTKSY